MGGRLVTVCDRPGAAGGPGRNGSSGPSPAPFRLAILALGALALLAPGQRAAAEAEAAWETTVTVGGKSLLPTEGELELGEEWERGYRRQRCMSADSVGDPWGTLPLQHEPEGFGVDREPEEKRTYYDNCFGTVTDDTFRYKGLSLSIEGIYHYITQTALMIDFKRKVPTRDLARLRGGWFRIGGRTFTVDDGVEGLVGDGRLTDSFMWAVPFWQDHMGWDLGDKIKVSFHPPPSAVPEPVSATVSATGTEIALVFDEALDAAARSAPPTGAFTVTADGGEVALDAAEVDASAPRQVLLSGLSPAILPGQAVVVAYADPTDGDDDAAVQDADGNDAPSFTTGADGVPAAVNGAVPLLSVADVTVTEGTDAEAEFAVTLVPAATETVTVDYATSDGSAEAGMDYTETSGTLTFNAGETSKTVRVSITDDDVEDSGETFTLTLSNPSGAAFGDAEATATILNDEGDAAPELLHAVANGKTVVLTYDAELDEGSAPTRRAFTVKADATSLALAARDPVAVSGATVTLTLWSRVDRDHTVTVSYAVPSSNPLQDASENPAAALVDHEVRNDTTDTRVGSGGPVAHVGDPAWSTSVTVGSRVHLNNDRTAGGELVRGYDRQWCLERRVEFFPQPYPGLGVEDPEDRRSGYDNCFGTIGDDTLEHGDLTLGIEGLYHFVVERVVMIRFRESVPREQLEGLRGGWFVLKDRKFPVDWALRGNASEFDRFDWGAGFWRANMGWTVGETIPVSFHPAGSAVPALSVESVKVTEGRDATADFTVRLSPAVEGTVTVDYATADGSARAPDDYTAASGTLTFAPGETEKTVSVPIVDDSVEDSGEKFKFRLSNASGGAAILGYGAATATIANHELTAEFSGAPAGHGGEPFMLELEFNDSPEMSYRVLQPVNGREGRLNVVNATALRVRRVDPPGNRRWLLTFAPAGTGDVTVTLPATTDCEAAGAICTADGRPLSAAAAVTVPHGEPLQAQDTPFAARLEALPEEHDGESALAFEVRFSEEPDSYSYRTLRDETLEIRQGGTRLAPRVQRMARSSSRIWTVTVEPVSKADIAIAIAATADCEAAGAVCNADGEPLSNGVSATVPGPPGLSVADAAVTEAAGATLDFQVTLGRASASTVTVDYRTWDGTATAGADYTSTSGTLSFAPGETAKTVSVPVLDDAHDEGSETMTLALSDPSGGNAWIADAHAAGTIENTDAMPGAWLGRFGRTVADQVLDAVASRAAGERSAGTEVTLAGERVGNLSAEDRRVLESLEEVEAGERGLTLREFLSGSSFAMTSGTSGEGFGAVWGRGAVSSFSGREDGGVSLEGDVESLLLGMDYQGGDTAFGVMLAHSLGEGTFTSAVDGGDLESDLTGIYPWGRHALSDRLSVWGAGGYGSGTLKLTPEGQGATETDMDLVMLAGGLRGELLSGGAGGRSLAATADWLGVRTSSDRARTPAGGILAGADATVTRFRVGLEGSMALGLGEGGGLLTPMVELGLRHDDGDAETGFGADMGLGVTWSAPSLGLEAALRGRGLLTHESDGFDEEGFSGSLVWDPSPDTDRGVSLKIGRHAGAEASGGVRALFDRGSPAGIWPAEEGAGGVGGGHRRLEATLGYGFPAFGGRYTATPEIGYGESDGGRDLRLGWRLTRTGPGGIEFGFDVGGRHIENMDDGTGHEFGLGFGWRLEEGRPGGMSFDFRVEGLRRDLDAGAHGPGPGSGAGRHPEHGVRIGLTARW